MYSACGCVCVCVSVEYAVDCLASLTTLTLFTAFLPFRDLLLILPFHNLSKTYSIIMAIDDDTERTTVPKSASHRVYRMPELLERILDNLDDSQLRRLMHTDRTIAVLAHRLIAIDQAFSLKYVNKLTGGTVSGSWWILDFMLMDRASTSHFCLTYDISTSFRTSTCRTCRAGPTVMLAGKHSSPSKLYMISKKQCLV